MIVIASVLALAGAACNKGTTVTTSSPTPSNTAPLGPSAPPAGYQALTTSLAPSNDKPVITIPDGAPPATLQITDLTVGTGAEVAAGATVTVNYIGVGWEDKTEFDASFGGQPATFGLGQVIPGWTNGIPGMKVGGRRQLVIPPGDAYGPAGSGHQLAGKTLVFVIDLLAIA